MSTPKPLAPLLNQGRDTLNLESSFLTTKEMVSFSKSCKYLNSVFKKTIFEKKKISELLQYVFDADPKKVEEFLSQYKPSSKECIILTKSSCKEGYYSYKLERMMYKRVWDNISPLQAAAWCGDNFLVRTLLNYVPESFHKEAARQLQNVLGRSDTEQNGSHMAPFKALTKAYRKYFEFNEDIKYNIVENLNKKEILWNQVWVRQRLLPSYGLQEFCHNMPCQKEPGRFYVYYNTQTPIDLDDMPFGSALYRSHQNFIPRPRPRHVPFLPMSDYGDRGVQIILSRRPETTIEEIDYAGAWIISSDSGRCVFRGSPDLESIQALIELRTAELKDLSQDLGSKRIIFHHE